MKYAKLGRTGLDCSRLGFGTWQIGGGRWKGLGEGGALELIKCSRDLGINIYDAAMVYGQYHGALHERRSRSLELLGGAFADGGRGEAIICLKLGQLDEYSHRGIYEPRSMVEELLRALRELRMDYVDICLVHAPTLSEVRDGRALAVVQTIQGLGAARFVGYSFEAEPEHALLALEQGIDVMMLQYNLLDEECARVFSVADERGVGVLVGGPYKRGYLSGRYEWPEDLPIEDDYWAWNLRYNRGKVEAILADVRSLRDTAGGPRGLRELAIRHILRNRGATVAVVGHRSLDEVIDNVALVDEILAQPVVPDYDSGA